MFNVGFGLVEMFEKDFNFDGGSVGVCHDDGGVGFCVEMRCYGCWGGVGWLKRLVQYGSS